MCISNSEGELKHLGQSLINVIRREAKTLRRKYKLSLKFKENNGLNLCCNGHKKKPFCSMSFIREKQERNNGDYTNKQQL